ncbi:NADH:flavin oxidoreductase [Acidaminobacter sp. JC074]|uniref:NADH:flavin oxidoreductase n=1 Tax=Acidaminobacter sp. JC074 TaxID=2530199 RepID=UPI001F114162|nr:NADH:flavin oxidoreductase [Acidaminobacter sp. JC074]MCH4887215.1 NADH:flavin oxidoreductase [Acidaminobacter sp. JC074]
MTSLYNPTRVKNMKLKNRFFKAAVWEGLAKDDGHMTQKLYDIYESYARGGVGTIFTGYAYISKDEKPNPKMMGIYSDDFIKDYKKLTDMVHSYDANIVMQIVYGGSQSHLEPPSQEILGPSSITNELTGIKPKEMTKEDIDTLIQFYKEAARRVKSSGFDGLCLHAAHGYLLSQFLCPRYNKRKDEYGGSLENRARIILEVIQSIRQEVGSDYPIFVKINSEDFMEDGLSSRESIEVSKMLEKASVDAIEVSGGNESTKSVLENNLGPARKIRKALNEEESYFKEHALKLKEAVSVPVILTGGNRDYHKMNELLKQGIDYFGLGRPLTCQADLVNMWNKDKSKKSRCVSCNQCYHTPGKRCIFNIKD